MWALFSIISFEVCYVFSSHSIFYWIFNARSVFHISTEFNFFCKLENKPMKKIRLEVQLRKILRLSWNIFILHFHDHWVLTIQVCWRIYQFEDKQLVVFWTQDNWNIISSLWHQNSFTSSTSPSPHVCTSNFSGATTPCPLPLVPTAITTTACFTALQQ